MGAKHVENLPPNMRTKKSDSPSRILFSFFHQESHETIGPKAKIITTASLIEKDSKFEAEDFSASEWPPIYKMVTSTEAIRHGAYPRRQVFLSVDSLENNTLGSFFQTQVRTGKIRTISVT